MYSGILKLSLIILQIWIGSSGCNQPGPGFGCGNYSCHSFLPVSSLHIVSHSLLSYSILISLYLSTVFLLFSSRLLFVFYSTVFLAFYLYSSLIAYTSRLSLFPISLPISRAHTSARLSSPPPFFLIHDSFICRPVPSPLFLIPRCPIPFFFPSSLPLPLS